MTNHPNRKPTPFQVRAYPGDVIAKCTTENQAHLIAALWSRHWASWAEVDYRAPKNGDGSGLVGQFSGGEPTPEFAHLRPLLVNNRILAEVA